MTPFYSDDWLTVYGGDCRTALREMEPESINCVVTSPPYWGLRDYGVAGQLGLEATPEEYVAAMVDVFREVRRVLRSDGTVWLNLGDSYANNGPGSWGSSDKSTLTTASRRGAWAPGNTVGTTPPKQSGLKPKDLVGIPWRVAFALQADGWYLRSDIIWSKPNPMPESVTDRPTKSHEYLFLLSKGPRYFFDADAVREDGPSYIRRPGHRSDGASEHVQGRQTNFATRVVETSGRNIRSVWTVATQPYPGAHFATFPPKLIEPCILAGCPDRVCSECGAPWERVTKRIAETSERHPRGKALTSPRHDGSAWNENGGRGFMPVDIETLGWRPTCVCGQRAAVDADGGLPDDGDRADSGRSLATLPGVVLDPFAGTGTVGMVAQKHSRRAVLIDLNPDYLRQCLGRNAQAPLGLPA